MPDRWARQLGLLAFWLIVGSLIGVWIGALAWALVGTLSLYIAWSLFRLYQLDRAIMHGIRSPEAVTTGLWSELHAKVYKIRQKSRARKQRHLRFIREVRESTSAISDAGVILNAAHEIVWFNPAARKLLGLSGEQDLGQRIDNLIRHPKFIEFLKSPGEKPLAVSSPVTADGLLSMQVIPYGDDQLLVIARDTTSEALLERTRRDFVANASHELRSPLTVISGYLDAFADDPELPDSWQGPLREMIRQVQRMTQILRDLIELTRLETADEPAGFDYVNPRDILDRIQTEYAARHPVPNLQFDIRSDAGLLGNETEIYSIFYNLISNAVRFTPAAGQIDIVWFLSASNDAVLEVRDTGIGIAAELIPRLTERFYRVDPGRSRASGGTGLGLAIVRHALQRHDARLEVESTEGHGSTFRCVFSHDRVARRAAVTDKESVVQEV